MDETETCELGAELIVDLSSELHTKFTEVVSGDPFVLDQHLTELFNIVAFIKDVPFEVVGVYFIAILVGKSQLNRQVILFLVGICLEGAEVDQKVFVFFKEGSVAQLGLELDQYFVVEGWEF